MNCNTDDDNNDKEQTTDDNNKTTSTSSPTTPVSSAESVSTTSTNGDTFTNTEKTSSVSSDEHNKELNIFRKQIYIIYPILLIVNIILIFIAYLFIKYIFVNRDHKNNIKFLFSITFIIMASSIIISYIIKCSKSDKVLYFSEYIGVKGYSIKQFNVGMVTNIIFGFIDNFSIYYGKESIKTFLGGGSTASNMKNLRVNGISNTFSDFLGAFVGNAVGDSVSTLSGIEKTPIISEIVGIVIGCLLGIIIPQSMRSEKGVLNFIGKQLSYLFNKSLSIFKKSETSIKIRPGRQAPRRPPPPSKVVSGSRPETAESSI